MGCTDEILADRIVRAECQASGSPKDTQFETIRSFPVTADDAAATAWAAEASAEQLGRPGLWRTDLQQHDLCVLGHEVIQDRVGIAPKRQWSSTPGQVPRVLTPREP